MCQHGDSECLGNAIEACTFDIAGQAKGLELATCIATAGNAGHVAIEMAAYDCLNEIQVDTESIRSCAFGQRGRELAIQIGERANRAELQRQYVPWVTVDGQQLEMSEDHDLAQGLCGLMAEPLPALCSTYKNTQPPPMPKATDFRLKHVEGKEDGLLRVCHRDRLSPF